MDTKHTTVITHIYIICLKSATNAFTSIRANGIKMAAKTEKLNYLITFINIIILASQKTSHTFHLLMLHLLIG